MMQIDCKVKLKIKKKKKMQFVMIEKSDIGEML